MTYYLATQACAKFFSFVGGYDTNEDKEYSFRYLQDYILRWIEKGDAVEETGGDFATYALAVALIVAEWASNPSALDFNASYGGTRYKRTVEGAFDEDWSGSLCLEPGTYQVQKFRQLCCVCPGA